MRGAMTALLWFWKPASPHVATASPDEAVAWCFDKLERAGVGMTLSAAEVRAIIANEELGRVAIASNS